MDYKSNRSDLFRLWLAEMNESKLEDLLQLEKAARLLVHRYDLIGEVSTSDIHGVARIAKKIQSQYEHASQ